MNDSDNNDAGDIIDQVYSTPKLTKKAGRNNDIYERFINRVQNIESQTNKEAKQTKNLTKSKESSAYESLSLEESISIEADSTADIGKDIASIALISSSDIEDNSKSASITVSEDHNYDKGDAHESKTTLTSEVNSNTKNISKEQSKRSSNKSIKLIIIGVVCGLLILIGAVVFIAISVSSQLSKSDSPTDEISATQNSVPVANNTNKNLPVTTIDTNTQTDSAPVVEPMPIIDSEGIENPITEAKPAKKVIDTQADSAKLSTTQGSVVKGIDSAKADTDAAISLEDFKEEAQSTLYRETND